MPKLIKCDGSVESLPDASLETLKQAVGGYIEAVPLNEGRYLIVNEDGLALELPHNLMATTLMHMAGHHPTSSISGDAVLCEPGEIS